ncbi:MAG: hypothetical protein ABI220_04230 [Candidatus Saccharimonadales bacterium]
MFSRPSAIIFLRRNSLIVVGRHISAAKLNLPVDIVNNMEVLDRERLVSACQDFFADHDLKSKRCLLVLDQSVVFTKTLEHKKGDDSTSALESYISAMPFEPGKRACLGVEQDDRLLLFATNAELYQTIAEALKLSGAGKLVAITPIAAYELGKDSESGAAVKRLIEDKIVHAQADFSTVSAA